MRIERSRCRDGRIRGRRLCGRRYAVAAFLSIAAATIPLSVARVASAQSDTQQRATLLADSVGAELDHKPPRSIGYVVGTVGTLAGGTFVYFAARSGSVSAGDALALTSAALMAGGGFASTQVDGHYSDTVLSSSIDASLGSLALGEGMIMKNVSRTPFVVAAAAFYTRSALSVVDAIASRPTSRAELLRDYHSIWTAAQRSTVSAERLHSIVRDLDGSGPWMSPWLLHAPLLVGGVVDLAMLARSDYNGADRDATGYLGGFQLLYWLAGMSLDTTRGRDRYRHELERTRMRVAIGPGPGLGLGVSGRF